jgi:hypothetical protein
MLNHFLTRDLDQESCTHGRKDERGHENGKGGRSTDGRSDPSVERRKKKRTRPGHSHGQYLALLGAVFPHCLIPRRGSGRGLRTPPPRGGDLRGRSPSNPGRIVPGRQVPRPLYQNSHRQRANQPPGRQDWIFVSPAAGSPALRRPVAGERRAKTRERISGCRQCRCSPRHL